MRRLFAKIRLDFFIIALIIIATLLCYKNYTPHTFLSGWDTLHPEFNLAEYLKRISTVWQSHQGLGAPPSQAHAAELSRMLIFIPLYLLLPLNLIRYSYFFLMIVAGPIGVYLLLNEIIGHDYNSKAASFLGGLIYLLNLGTMQHFIVPFEMFATNFGFIGFLFLFLTRYLSHGRKKDLGLFGLMTVLSSSMAHTATLWYIYFLSLASYLITFALLNKDRRGALFKKSSIILCLTLGLNLYWILPNLYYALNYGSTVVTSKIHRLFTEEAYLHNKNYGKVSDLLIFKNFLFDWRVLDNRGKTVLLLADWTTHLKNPFILFLGYLFSFFSIIGVFLAFKKRRVWFLSLVPFALISSVFLLPATPPFSFVFDFLRENDFFKEILRFPFTKFSIYIIFCFSIFFAYFQSFIFEKLNLVKATIYLYLFIFLIFIYSAPALRGSFISSVVRVKIPQTYFQLFDWSKTKDRGRILILPMNSLFGWNYHKWDNQIYEGAGFTWFGLKQPTLNREFDRWYPYNEQSYRELSYALYSKNKELFEKLLLKYNIKYVLLDKSIIDEARVEKKNKLFFDETLSLLSKSQSIKLEKSFGDNLQVFDFQPAQESDAQRRYFQTYRVYPSYRWNYIDRPFTDIGDYILADSSNLSDFTYPSQKLLDDTEKINKELFKINKNSYFFTPNLLSLGKSVKIPSIKETESIIYIDIYAKKDRNKIIFSLKYLLPYPGQEAPIQDLKFDYRENNALSINNKRLLIPQLNEGEKVFLGEAILYTHETNDLTLYFQGRENPQKYHDIFHIPKSPLASDFSKLVGAFPQEKFDFKLSTLTNQVYECGFERAKLIKKKYIENYLEYQAQDGATCDTLSLPELSQETGYILTFESQNLSGLPLKICFENSTSKRCDLEEVLSKNKNFELDYFIVPPYFGGLGYNLIINNFSIGDVKTINRLKTVKIVPFPYMFFHSIAAQSKNTPAKITVLTNNQAFEKGWKAYLRGKELKHVLVNNWANGWEIPVSSFQFPISIIFWPQYLEYFGFLILILAFFWVAFWL